MKCKALVRDENFLPYFVNWANVGQFWDQSNQYYICPDSLYRAYNIQWFVSENQFFWLAELQFDKASKQFIFKNGKHRTTLLSSLIEQIPIAVHRDTLNTEQFQQIVIRPIQDDEYFDLPELDFLSTTHLIATKI